MGATPQWLVDAFDRGRIRRQLPSSAQIDIESTYGRSNVVISSSGRPSLQHRRPSTDDREPPPAAGSPTEEAIVAKFVRSWESADLDALVALLTGDVFMSMPPMPFESLTRFDNSVLPQFGLPRSLPSP